MKLNEWIDEERDLEVNTIDFVDGKVTPTTKTVKVKMKTMYVNPPAHKVMCKKGEHDWYSLDPSQGLFACSKCEYKRIVEPVTYEYFKDDKGGHLRHKITGLLL